MFRLNLKRELYILGRNGWFVALSVLMIALTFYAFYNGNAHYEQGVQELREAQEKHADAMASVRQIATAIANGEEPENAYAVSPLRFSFVTGALAMMEPSPYSVLAIGQSDLYTKHFKVSIRDDRTLISTTELSNPVQLLLGNFDLAFVVIYLLPLLVIAFSYQLFSSEKESGSLFVLAANPIDLRVWLLQKSLIRFGVISFIFIVSFLLGSIVFAVPVDGVTLTMLACAIGYLAFWFALTFLIGTLGQSSAKNAISAVGIWILLVLLVPSAINQTAATFHPMPSRAQLINEVRLLKKDISKKQDEVLQEYLRNHPELIEEESNNQGSYWENYFASQELMEQELSPLITGFQTAIRGQQNWTSQLRFLSPAVLIMDSYNEMAGTSTRHYADFKDQVFDFHGQWRDFFVPYVFKDETLTVADIEQLPVFQYSDDNVNKRWVSNLLVLILLVVTLSAAGLLYRRKNTLHMVKS